ncbi:uncharacterized protein F5Z01DRAFT_473127 [Emericellopsis atlantica]|uniref:NACHT domain-containing protein n=1 Tax=Emericellopsis atlantica TaxID=2614577 RepID=A0A9P8CK74_9HYPO|nr:uncharacterized protein F5Z01DRAFT_473127 [Emericellopsis atlantica]KAG9249645.1 hypothetical protein F5Z01DRAFT_473127 [Emericellopsis atlantica]
MKSIADAVSLARLFLILSHQPSASIPSSSRAVIDAMSRPALEIIYEGTKPEVDIIAVHGLGANVDWSWTWKDPEPPERHVKWLQDDNMLPAVVPNSRILLYNYDSTWHADAPRTRLSLCGEELARRVRDFREGPTASRPIVFVGHSLGGNVIQHALLYANSDEGFRSIVMATAGIVLLGSPLRGSKLQFLSQVLASLLRPAGAHDGIVRELASNDPSLRDRLHDFCRMCNTVSIPVTCLFELYESNYGKRGMIGGVLKGMVVDEVSACIDGADRVSLQADHFGLNKYSGPDDRSFQTVSAELRRLCFDAPKNIQRRRTPTPVITDSKYLLAEKPEAKKCLPDLFLTDPYEDMQEMKRKKGSRAKNTCDWILGTDELTAWLGDVSEPTAPPMDVLWLYGNPGTGKSTMSMFLAEGLSEAFSKTPNKTLAYFFCDSGYDARNTARAIVRGLLLQLVQQHPQLIEHVLPKYEERKDRAFDSFDAVWTMFTKACADKGTGRKYCIVDALDECAQDEQETLLKQIEETFGGDQSSGRLNVSILLTSRPYPEIERFLSRFPKKNLVSFDESKRDIDKFIDEKVARLKRNNKYTDSLAGNIMQVLRDKADGIFLWVGLVCQELERTPSRKAVALLEKLPAGLQSLYKQLLDAALEQDEDSDVIKRLLSFVIVARRPFSTRELASACRLYQDEGEEERIQFTIEIIASCRLMIVVQDEKVLLLHQSVKDFLLGDIGSKLRFVNQLQTHNELANRCVECLIEKFSSLQRGGYTKEDGDLVPYSTQFWPEHAQMAAKCFMIEERQGQFFAIDSKIRDSWWKDYTQQGHKMMPSDLSVFHLAARWGLPALIDHALSSNPYHAGAPVSRESPKPYIDTAYRDSHGTTPLEQCARSSHIDILKIMLQRAEPRSHLEEAVVAAAAQNRNSGAELMEVLLDWKGDQVMITEDIVKAAAGNWGSGAEVIELLLDQKGDQVTITEDIVKAAAGNNKSGAKVIELLLDRRSDQVTITEDIVKAAAENVSSGAKVIELLLDRRGDQVTITQGAVTALSSRFGAEVIELLLDRRGDQVTITEDIVKTAAGNWRNGAKVIELLLDRRGDQFTITEDIVKTAAGNLWNGAKVIKLLLDQKRNQVTITEDIVKAAAGNNKSGAKVIELLLDRRGDQSRSRRIS